jgi:protein required for attachment to host cells
VNRICVIAADSAGARFFLVEETDAPRAPFRLVEREALHNPDLRTLGRSVTGRPRTETNTNREAGPMHPMGAQRDRHRVELEHRYALRIAALAGKITHAWKDGTVLLVADAKLLGLVREPLRKVLQAKIGLKELARNHAHLTPAELRDELVAGRILPA